MHVQLYTYKHIYTHQHIYIYIFIYIYIYIYIYTIGRTLIYVLYIGAYVRIHLPSGCHVQRNAISSRGTWSRGGHEGGSHEVVTR